MSLVSFNVYHNDRDCLRLFFTSAVKKTCTYFSSQARSFWGKIVHHHAPEKANDIDFSTFPKILLIFVQQLSKHLDIFYLN